MGSQFARSSTALAVLACLGCTPAGVAPGSEMADSPYAHSVHLPLKLSSGEPTDLSRLRGRPALLFLFATYDPACQLALEPLMQLHEQEHRLQFLGIAVQPDAESFLPPYASALGVPFPLAFDPSGNLLRGTTSLGQVPAVPYYVLLDAEGRVEARQVGGLDLDALRDFVAAVLR